jgi:arginine/ornithine N-succinyltransferase beta subunit
MGVVGEDFASTAGTLRAAGLRCGSFVTIDDGGPVYTAPRDALRAWRHAARVGVRATEPDRDLGAGETPRSPTADASTVAAVPWLVAVDSRTMVEVQGVRSGDELTVRGAAWRESPVEPAVYWAAPVSPA